MDRQQRSKITFEYDQAMEYEKWIKEIPYISFNKLWNVKIIPPFAGAIVRFQVEYQDNSCSVYLDGYSSLGHSYVPYWEIYPVNNDVFRCNMNDVDNLVLAIHCSLINICVPRDMEIIKEFIEENDIDLGTDEGMMAFKLMWI